ncbi:LysR family transcriptional regulator [Gilvimarinus sp. SDUM040013]|uniref:LysR family transcriptional regulator n=1 Tax=Gilvimarinus gilvus TaxID=3058038 RepID=A0ABU4S216_9GAMM|nr:LysR family transcriptional regulator [Gilvimarinus sp. SDUM040013]MDO3384761.1 LysR family transcriptional regulator [Gilvimarinus sp. SDUM040013]MDX6850421.1 LysR family transcriptional regulator [Gilvimarinus sp. SDUM040013]
MDHPTNEHKGHHLDDTLIAIEVLRRGSFAAAAKRLNMPTSTVSRRITNLEAALGVRLLDRTSRKVRHTEQGKLLLSLCENAIDEISANLNTVVRSKHTLSGPIRITAPVLLGNELFSGWFSEFMREYPDVTLDVLLSNRNEDLLTKDIDLAIRLGPLPDSGFIGQRLFTTHSVLCASPHLWDAQRQVTLTQLQELPFLLMNSQRDGIMFETERSGVSNFRPSKIALVSNDLALIREATLAGSGVACLPKEVIASALQQGTLINIAPYAKINTPRHIYAFYPSRRYMPEKVQRFLEFISKKCEQYS